MRVSFVVVDTPFTTNLEKIYIPRSVFVLWTFHFRSIFSPEEITLLRSALGSDDGVKSHAYELSATEHGRKIHMCLWNQPGNDVTGMAARSEKIVGTMEKVNLWAYE